MEYNFRAAVNLNLILTLLLLFFPPLFSKEKMSYLLTEYNEGAFRILDAKNSKALAPMGSLLKPFAAWYLLENGADPHNKIFCPINHNKKDPRRCWTPAGHGAVDLEQALIHSCNFYFANVFVAQNLRTYQDWLSLHFQWPKNIPMLKSENAYGFDLKSGLPPAQILKMYAALIEESKRGNPYASRVTQNLEHICQGTFKEACDELRTSRDFSFILGKTGTNESGQRPFGAALYFVEYIPTKMKILLLAYERGRTGSQVAKDAQEILKEYAKQDKKRRNNRR